MGTTFRFRCSRCGLTAEVSGGPDGGFLGRTETVFCRPCGALRDVATTFVDVDEVYGGPPRQGPPLHRCGVCGKTDHAPWEENDPCPVCGGSVVNEGMAAQWD